MRSRLLAFLAVALVWCSPAAAVIGMPVNLASGGSSSAITTFSLSTTADAPTGNAIIGIAQLGLSSTALAVTDSKNNSYTVEARFVGGSYSQWVYHADNPADLPAPCTVTATGTTTTLIITALGTCTSGMSFGNGTVVTEAISGGSFTGAFATSTPCSLASLPVTCTITGGAVIGAGATATLSSRINGSWTSSTRPGFGIISVSGLVTASARDVLGAGNTTGSPGTTSSIATGTLAQANEIVIVFTAVNVSVTAYSPGGSFTSLAGTTGIPIPGGNGTVLWAYQNSGLTTAGVTNTSTWTTSAGLSTNIYSFKGVSTGSAACSLSLLGVGVC